MERLVIIGGKSLNGKVKISGAKNSALAIICASVMVEGKVILENVPEINDVRVLLSLLENMGISCQWQGEDILELNNQNLLSCKAVHDAARQLRASNLLLGPLLARCHAAKIALPGGCNIGSRPMDLHFKGLRALGAEVDMDEDYITASCEELHGDMIYLDFPSVGATENIMMLASISPGSTVINNAAKEPEIVDLANFLNTMGAKIRGAGTDEIRIEGVAELKGRRHQIIPDRIEAGTFMVAAAASHGDITLENVIPIHLEPLIAKLREAGVYVDSQPGRIQVKYVGDLRPLNIKTMPYPGFPTDMQSQFMAFLSTVEGKSTIVENVFEKRYRVVDEFKRMGAKIKVEERTATIEGVHCLEGARVQATDLRAGAALVIAGLIAEGRTEISNVHYIDRGYHNLEQKLKELGADISREND